MDELIIRFARNPQSRYKYNDYRNEDAVKNLINYVYHNAVVQIPKGERIYGAIGTIGRSREEVINSFMLVKKIYGKEYGVQVKHIIVSFGEKRDIPYNKMKKFIEKLIRFFSRDYMVAYGVHYTPNNYHLHMAINSVSKYGMKINIKYETLCDFRQYANNLWKKWRS